MGTNLPLDVILAILVRLPVKSLQRFKCVCKEWFNLINDPLFIKLHLQKFNDNCDSKPSSIACLHNNNDRLYLLDDLDSLGSQPTEINELPPLVHEKDHLVGSCNGLLCFFYYKDCRFCIYNPSTGTIKEIIFPWESLGTHIYVRGFGYDCENDDYKIVLMDWPCGKDMFVYSLRQNLRMQHSSLANSTAFSGYFCTGDALFMKKRLHWAVLTGNRPQIAHFNLCSERWEELISPIIPIEYIHKLAVLDGCLCLCSSKDSITDIWIMKEYGVKESWTKLASVPCVLKPFGPLRVAPVKIEDLSTCLPYARSLVSIP